MRQKLGLSSEADLRLAQIRDDKRLPLADGTLSVLTIPVHELKFVQPTTGLRSAHMCAGANMALSMSQRVGVT